MSSVETIIPLAKGKRGVVSLLHKQGKLYVIKEKNPLSKAPQALLNEAKFLHILNKHNIGPKLITSSPDCLLMEYVEGARIQQYLQTCNKQQAVHILQQILHQLHTMDVLGINKYEMTNPYKHIIITHHLEPIMIDFERCKYTKKPKNVTQFLQYLARQNILTILHQKGFNWERTYLLRIAQEYKKNMDKKLIDQLFKGIVS